MSVGEEEEEKENDPKMHTAIIPHSGRINRIRVSVSFFSECSHLWLVF